MIRDPSDGTVKPIMKPVIEAGTSGLQTDKLKAEELARLKESREWLAQYRKAVDDLNWMNDKGEITKRSPDSGEG